MPHHLPGAHTSSGTLPLHAITTVCTTTVPAVFPPVHLPIYTFLPSNYSSACLVGSTCLRFSTTTTTTFTTTILLKFQFIPAIYHHHRILPPPNLPILFMSPHVGFWAPTYCCYCETYLFYLPVFVPVSHLHVPPEHSCSYSHLYKVTYLFLPLSPF